MESLLYGLALLACPVGMGAMMWMMMRGQRTGSGTLKGPDQVAELRSEIDLLKAERAAQRAKGGL
ncbi:hypothetical protein I4I73_16485 [Pseudonocardia sp. KRD-184]|uniref:DUF2933 family protein n=1 Tax=Pseudonocardia oceani TaxID=2792013 RepID=A0ABS6U3F4_9PSEU|nr:hypothetical protein [Pseudonocardia oceani]MBW0090381.1 hypothetical protein [Pseudonocardia oceani]MBW0097580.1 hypothetical protein [Pseudonocardia oceani]MBW0120922.1 hypothetical protein [Pseudonocardia oceani]MBW0126536.1 hypothetical protein [Pseudonocardia oceani]